MNPPEAGFQPDSSQKALTKDMPVGHLIGFEIKESADGRAIVALLAGPQH